MSTFRNFAVVQSLDIRRILYPSALVMRSPPASLGASLARSGEIAFMSTNLASADHRVVDEKRASRDQRS